MKVLIIEDEAPAFRRLQRILEDLDEDIEIVDVFDTVKDSISWFEDGGSADLIFMDIQLADGLSFEIFKSVEIKTPVVFTTAYDEYTLKAFEVNSIDYLLKPIDKERLKQSLDKWDELKQLFSGGLDLNRILDQIKPESKKYRKRFLVRIREQLIPIKTEEIAYFYTENGVVYLQKRDDRKYPLEQTLDQLEMDVDPDSFYRLNRQFLCSIDALKSSHTYDKGKILVELAPKPQEVVLVSRDKASQFKRWLEGK
ncbi:MAG: DNA-binding response regulator [Flavobacteriales bacterium]|nr:DNA-binding response regulator [Flavobacteriales bacterium]|tara:strand:+ start:142 stop:903 length:762 start_codon:yes stop_codon:yes gene_type:complete